MLEHAGTALEREREHVRVGRKVSTLVLITAMIIW